MGLHALLLRVPPSALAACASFYGEALSLRAATPASATDARFSGGGSGGCGLHLRVGASTPPPLPRLLEWPLFTFGVSNLRTASRHAKRWGGAVLDAPPGEGAAADAAVFVDPTGRRCIVRHAYRRAPAVSVTLGVADVAASADFFSVALGFAPLSRDEARAVHPTQAAQEESATGGGGTRQRWVALGLPSNAAHHSTPLVLEEAAEGGDDRVGGIDPEAVLCVRVIDVAAAHAAFLQRGLPTSPLAPGASPHFTALTPDHYTLLVEGRLE